MYHENEYFCNFFVLTSQIHAILLNMTSDIQVLKMES